MQAMTNRASRSANTKKIVGSDDAILMLSKLGWEIRSIYENPKDGVAERIYRSLNCAMTAWHIADWLWMLSSKSQREFLLRFTKAHETQAGTFPVAVQRWCPYIGLCRQIATTAKHLTDDFDRSEVWLESVTDDEAPEFATTLYIFEGDRKHLDLDVYQETFAAWSALYVQLGMPKARDVYLACTGESLPQVTQISITTEDIGEGESQ